MINMTKLIFGGISGQSRDIKITGDTFLSEQMTSRLHENVKLGSWEALCSLVDHIL